MGDVDGSLRTDRVGRLRPVRGQIAHVRDSPVGTAVWVDQRASVLVLSGLEMAEYPDGSGEVGEQWHLSISCKSRRPTNEVVRDVLDQFGIVEFEEDNHEPGRARHIWIPCDPARRVECECKSTELQMFMLDGTTWSNLEPETGECAGCTMQNIGGHPCQVHSMLGASPTVAR